MPFTGRYGSGTDGPGRESERAWCPGGMLGLEAGSIYWLGPGPGDLSLRLAAAGQAWVLVLIAWALAPGLGLLGPRSLVLGLGWAEHWALGLESCWGHQGRLLGRRLGGWGLAELGLRPGPGIGWGRLAPSQGRLGIGWRLGAGYWECWACPSNETKIRFHLTCQMKPNLGFI